MADTKYPPVFDQYNRPESGSIKDYGPSRSKLEFLDEADINKLMEQYIQTGEIPTSITGTYGDFSEAVDFLEAQVIIARADAQFSALPARVRNRFDNDPGQFLDFVHNANLEELHELGLLNKEASDRLAAPAPKPPEPKLPEVAPAPKAP